MKRCRMTDIIANAKQLLDGATPGPWVISGEFDPECPELQGAPQLENGLLKVPIISHDIYGDFFPEDGDLIAKSWTNAKALAEETYFYGVQVWMGGRWIMMLNSNHGTSLMHRGKWFERKDEAQACAAKWNHDTPTRIVRQRRSPMEVINE